MYKPTRSLIAFFGSLSLIGAIRDAGLPSITDRFDLNGCVSNGAQYRRR